MKIGSLKEAISRTPKSELLKESFVIEALLDALKSRDSRALDEALKVVRAPLTGVETLRYQDGALASDWPEGFEKVCKKFGFDRQTVKDYKGERFDSMVEMLVSDGLHELLEHVWKSAADKDKHECLKRGITLGVAKVVVKSGEDEMLKEELNSQVPPEELRKLVFVALQELSALVVDSKKEKEISEVCGVLKAVLSGAGATLTHSFWQEVCKQDNVQMLKQLIEEEVIGDRSLSARQTPAKTFGYELPMQIDLDLDMLSKNWFLGYSGDGEVLWTPSAMEPHSFNLADLVCLHSKAPFNLLGHLLLDKDFASEISLSPIARHAFLEQTKGSMATVGLYEELHGSGVDMSLMVNDLGQNPLHLTAMWFKKANDVQDSELVLRLLSLCPAWATALDENKKSPVDYVMDKHKDQWGSLVAHSQLGDVLVLGLGMHGVRSSRGVQENKPRL